MKVKVNPRTVLVLLSIAVMLVVNLGCEKDKEVGPSSLADSTGVHEIFDISAIATTRIADKLPGNVIRYGHVWAKTSESTAPPTISNTKLETTGALPASGRFSSAITGLTVNTDYQLRAFVETNEGIAYGELKTFKTAKDYISRLVRALDDSLKNRGFGYSFIVTQKDQIVGEGFGGLAARSVEDGGERPVSLDSKMQIASMTKTITAAAFLKLAEGKGIKTTDKILPYIPKSWIIGPNIDKITFRDLMFHQSGIIGLAAGCVNRTLSDNGWYGLQALIEKGVESENYGKRCYQNANYGLFRILIPSILGYAFKEDNYTDDQETRKIYEKYIQDEVLVKLGVTSSEILVNSTTAPTYGYDFPFTEGVKGYDPGDLRNAAGGYGIYLSAHEASKVFSKLFSKTDVSVLSNAMKDTILTNGLGSYSTVTPQGKFSYHDGWWPIKLRNGNYSGFRSLWMTCPDDITVVLFTNGLRHDDGLFPIRSNNYSDITSYVLWAFSGITTSEGARKLPVNFDQYLKDLQPH